MPKFNTKGRIVRKKVQVVKKISIEPKTSSELCFQLFPESREVAYIAIDARINAIFIGHHIKEHSVDDVQSRMWEFLPHFTFLESKTGKDLLENLKWLFYSIPGIKKNRVMLQEGFLGMEHIRALHADFTFLASSDAKKLLREFYKIVDTSSCVRCTHHEDYNFTDIKFDRMVASRTLGELEFDQVYSM